MDITFDKTSVGMSSAAESPPVQQVEVASRSSQAENASTRLGRVDDQVIQELAAKIQKQHNNISLSFSTYGQKSGKVSITVSEKETGKVIREIPPEEIQQLSGKMEEMLGMLFNGMV